MTPSQQRFVRPVSAEWPVSQPYGYDPTYTGRDDHVHLGIDYACPIGTPVYAAEGGIIGVAASNQPQGFPGALDGAWGNAVGVQHNDGVVTWYCHLSSIVVLPGQYVTQGTLLGHSGDTGLTFGPHLHFQVVANGERVDPATVGGVADA